MRFRAPAQTITSSSADTLTISYPGYHVEGRGDARGRVIEDDGRPLGQARAHFDAFTVHVDKAPRAHVTGDGFVISVETRDVGWFGEHDKLSMSRLCAAGFARYRNPRNVRTEKTSMSDSGTM